MRRSVNRRVRRGSRIFLAKKDADRADARDAALSAEGTRFSHLRLMRPDF